MYLYQFIGDLLCIILHMIETWTFCLYMVLDDKRGQKPILICREI